VSWLRLDDGFARHPKVLALSEAKRWRWVVLLTDCARVHHRGGIVSSAMLREVGLTREELLELELLDELEDGSLRVHDWDDYNPSDNAQALRQKRYRMRRAGVDEDEIMRVAPPRVAPERDVTRDVAVMQRENISPRARVPSRPVTPAQDGTAAKDASTDAARASDEDAGRLRALLPLDVPRAEYVRGLALRSPADEVQAITRELGAGVVDPLEHAIRRLRAVAT